MKKKSKIVGLLISFTFIGLVIFYFLINSILGQDKYRNLKSLLSNEQKLSIKKYIFPFKSIDIQTQEINKLKNIVDLFSEYSLDLELQFIASGNDINISKEKQIVSGDFALNKYRLLKGFYSGINNSVPGSGYIDFYDDNMFILSSRGVLAYANNLNDGEIFYQIKNNINEFIDIRQFSKISKYDNLWFSLKDLHIFKDQIFISYTEEFKKDCWNTSVIYGNIDYKDIIFKKLFSAKKCVHSIDNIDKEFNAHQSGGRIINFDKDHILLSIGDYRSRFLAQDKKSVNGKIIKINILNSEHSIISMGHRNPQGLFFDKENNIILETEHGPQGGDEINIIDIGIINKNNIPNYGWAIASAGEHYKGRIEINKKKYEKYPLYKSHRKHGFVEPLKSFVPSIGISEVAKIERNKYVVSSMRDRSLYFFEIGNGKKIENLKRVEVFERVRDLKVYKKKIYLFLEDTASIGVINLK